MTPYSELGQRLRNVDALRLVGDSLSHEEDRSRLRAASGRAARKPSDKAEDVQSLLKRIDEEMAGKSLSEPPPRRRSIVTASLSAETRGEAENDIPGYRELRELTEAFGPEKLQRNAFSETEAESSRGLSALYARIVAVLQGVGEAFGGFSIAPSPRTGGIALRLGPDGDLDIALPDELATSSPTIFDERCGKALGELELRLERAEAALELCAKVAEVIAVLLSLLTGASTTKVIMTIARALVRLFTQIRESPK